MSAARVISAILLRGGEYEWNIRRALGVDTYDSTSIVDAIA